MNEGALAFNACRARLACSQYIRESGLSEKALLYEMLLQMGARTSLSRIKIVALLFNDPGAAGLTPRQVCDALEQRTGFRVGITSLHGSLQRIERHGIVELTEQRTYRLSDAAVLRLCQLVEQGCG